MILRALDSSGDWTFGKGKSNYLREEAAIRQNISSRVSSWVGDCFFALSDGVDWTNRLDVGEQENVADEVAGVILASYGVVGVSLVETAFSGKTRGYSVNYQADTIYGAAFQNLISQGA
jgi:hypothetical protein